MHGNWLLFHFFVLLLFGNCAKIELAHYEWRVFNIHFLGRFRKLGLLSRKRRRNFFKHLLVFFFLTLLLVTFRLILFLFVVLIILQESVNVLEPAPVVVFSTLLLGCWDKVAFERLE